MCSVCVPCFSLWRCPFRIGINVDFLLIFLMNECWNLKFDEPLLVTMNGQAVLNAVATIGGVNVV